MPNPQDDPLTTFLECYGKYLDAREANQPTKTWLLALQCRLQLQKMGDPKKGCDSEGPREPDHTSFVSMRMDDELTRLVETLSQHLEERITKERENPELEKHLVSVALVPLIERAIRPGLTESEFLDECGEIWEIQTNPEKYRV